MPTLQSVYNHFAAAVDRAVDSHALSFPLLKAQCEHALRDRGHVQAARALTEYKYHLAVCACLRALRDLELKGYETALVKWKAAAEERLDSQLFGDALNSAITVDTLADEVTLKKGTDGVTVHVADDTQDDSDTLKMMHGYAKKFAREATRQGTDAAALAAARGSL